mmetsp:Transcript_85907/g.246598  ORF Transcript_85907/g.246598 Transcript_85907/m.246598 type:complete len:117 (+) Transcript_85907:208-558(+)
MRRWGRQCFSLRLRRRWQAGCRSRHMALAAARACHQRGTFRAMGVLLQTIVVEELPQDGERDCPVCLDSLFPEEGAGQVVRTLCGHHFHAACLHEWSARTRSCPLCKAGLKDGQAA